MKLLQRILLALLLLGSSCSFALGKEIKKEVLPGTKPLTLEGDLAERMLSGAHRFLDRKLAEVLVRRSNHWEKGLSSLKNKESFLDENRKVLARILGITEKRVPFEAPSLTATTTRSAKVATGSGYEIFAVRWPVLKGVFGEGLLLRPTGRKPVANVIAIPDADQSPEDVAGLTTKIAYSEDNGLSELPFTDCLKVVNDIRDGYEAESYYRNLIGNALIQLGFKINL